MIKSLHRNIVIAAVSCLSVLLIGAIIALLYSANNQAANLMNSALDGISIQDESMTFNTGNNQVEGDVPRNLVNMSAFYAVHINEEGNVFRILSRNAENAHDPISYEQVKEYALNAVSDNQRRGWEGSYRYKVMERENGGKTVLLADSYLMRNVAMQQAGDAIVILVIVYLVALAVMLIAIRVAMMHAEQAYAVQRRFVANAEHEMKTPLAIITMDLDLLERETGKSEWIDDMKAEAQNLTHLAKRLVDMSRLDENNGELTLIPTNVSLLVKDAMGTVPEQCQARSLSLVTHIEDNRHANASAPELRSTILEMLSNALRYCDKGGTIVVSLTRENHRVVFAVENTYADVARVDLNRIFERFYRSDKARAVQHGNGIGLSYARDVALAHKGTLTAYKDEDRGIIGFKLAI